MGRTKFLLPGLAALIAVGAFLIWFTHNPVPLPARVPGTDRAPETEFGSGANPVLRGKLISGPGTPGTQPGVWPQFRGPARDGISKDLQPLGLAWKTSAPQELWRIDAGEGYAGPIVANGRVYLMDYDQQKRQDALRCLSFDDGREIWRFAYPCTVKRNHGMSRTVPAISSNVVVAIGPKCHVVAVDAESGNLLWGKDMVRDFGATVPPWYAGQCPLIEGDRAILAPAGKDALLVAVDLRSGEVLWRSPNPRAWTMTHSSIMPADIAGTHTYVYCANKGVAGISAQDGAPLWETTEWKISIATVPSPLVLDGNRIFLSGGYNAGSLMLHLKKAGDKFEPEVLFRLGPEVFGATQQTPIYYGGHIYGVRPDGKFVCLTVDGKLAWVSDGKPFGLGPFCIGAGLVYALNDSGLLRVFEATPDKYTPVAQAQILEGPECWAPLVLTGERLLARDLIRVVCLGAPAVSGN